MIKSKKSIFASDWWLFVPIIIYVAGAFLIKHPDLEPLKEMGVAEQEEYVRYDSEGEEYEGETLITVKGLGTVLTYENIYYMSVPMLLLAPFLSILLFKEKVDELEATVFGNCIIGVLLIAVTTSVNIIPTVLFWLGIIAAGLKKDGKKNTA